MVASRLSCMVCYYYAVGRQEINTTAAAPQPISIPPGVRAPTIKSTCWHILVSSMVLIVVSPRTKNPNRHPHRKPACLLPCHSRSRYFRFLSAVYNHLHRHGGGRTISSQSAGAWYRCLPFRRKPPKPLPSDIYISLHCSGASTSAEWGSCARP